MRVIRGMHNFQHALQYSMVTIGNFDGVHLGHQAILQDIYNLAEAARTSASVITFEPPPAFYFAPETAPRRLMTLREKLRCFKDFNIAQTVVLPFNKKLAELSATEFMQQVLWQGLQAQYVQVGDDFRFGKNRAGDIQSLQTFGEQHGMQVTAAHTVEIDQQRVSSSAIRNALIAGDVATAGKMLGRPLTWEGRVVQGDQRGREWGFPTANLNVAPVYLPMTGVFAVQVYGLGSNPLNAVANLGVRPTVSGQKKRLLEVHILNFDEIIYGRRIRVVFLTKIRDEQKFASFGDLTAQIGRDVIAAKNFFEP